MKLTIDSNIITISIRISYQSANDIFSRHAISYIHALKLSGFHGHIFYIPDTKLKTNLANFTPHSNYDMIKITPTLNNKSIRKYVVNPITF